MGKDPKSDLNPATYTRQLGTVRMDLLPSAIVADPECLSWIRDPEFIHPGSRIPDPTTTTKEEAEKKHLFIVATNITKLKIILFLNR